MPRLQAKPNYVQSTVARCMAIEVSGRKKEDTAMYFQGGATSTVDAEMEDCRYGHFSKIFQIPLEYTEKKPLIYGPEHGVFWLVFEEGNDEH